MKELTHAELKRLVRYEPETGNFIRLVQTCSAVKVGDIAGWRKPKDGVVELYVGGRKYLAHRLAWFYMTGEWPENEIDHIDCDRSNNRWINLRPATRAENGRNRRKARNNTSGLKGVCWHRGKRRWQADIRIEGKPTWLGHFKTKEEAHAAYCAAALKHYGEFARFE